MTTRHLMLAGMALALVACGDAPQESPSGGRATPNVAPGARTTGDAVAAVKQSEGVAVATVSFVIGDRPVPGKAFPLTLTITSAEALPALQVFAEAEDLIVTPLEATVAVAAGTPTTHDLVVTAQKAGLSGLTLRLRSGAGPETVYQVPVMVAAAG